MLPGERDPRSKKIGAMEPAVSKTLVDAGNKEVGFGEPFAAGKSVALYFAGDWCPMCRDFTPQLNQFMEKHPDKRIIFVSSDFSKDEYDKHRSTLPGSMLSVPYGSPMQDSLKKGFRLWGGKESPTFGDGRRGGIPALVVISADGDEVKYLDAESKGAAALQDW